MEKMNHYLKLILSLVLKNYFLRAVEKLKTLMLWPSVLVPQILSFGQKLSFELYWHGSAGPHKVSFQCAKDNFLLMKRGKMSIV